MSDNRQRVEAVGEREEDEHEPDPIDPGESGNARWAEKDNSASTVLSASVASVQGLVLPVQVPALPPVTVQPSNA